MKKKKKTRVRIARGNMDVSLALMRCALACSVFILLAGALSISGLNAAMPDWALLIVQTLMTLLCFGLSAYRGLFRADGDLSGKLCRRSLRAGQILPLVMTGVLLTAPMTLLNDLIAAPFARGLAGAPVKTPPFALFLPVFIKSALIVPLCEELFFRGYLYAVLREAGLRYAAAVSSLLFALVHGVDAAFAPRFFLGLLLCALMLRTDSLLAALIVHAVYNAVIVLLSFLGAGALFAGLGFVSCLLRIAMSAAFVRVLYAVYEARRADNLLAFGSALTLGQCLTLTLSAAAACYIPLLLYAL